MIDDEKITVGGWINDTQWDEARKLSCNLDDAIIAMLNICPDKSLIELVDFSSFGVGLNWRPYVLRVLKRRHLGHWESIRKRTPSPGETNEIFMKECWETICSDGSCLRFNK